jgi:hypothetical protein
MYQYRYGVGRRTVEEKVEGYIDTVTRTYQVFYRQMHIDGSFFQTKGEKEILFEEEIPQDVLIEVGCFGSTYWKTSCPDDIYEKCAQKVIEPVPDKEKK